MKHVVLLMLVLIGAGCVDIEGPHPEHLTEDHILAAVRVSTPSIVMQVGDTIRVSLSAISMSGDDIPIENPSEIRWSSSDPEQVSVDSNGLVSAHLVSSSSAGVEIVARWKYRITTQVDTVRVHVTSDRLDITSVRLTALDSNRIGSGLLDLPPRVRADLLNGDNIVLEGAMLHLTAPEPIAVDFAGPLGNNGEMVFHVTNEKAFNGAFFIKAEGTVYGVEVSDSIEWTGLYPGLVAFILHEDAETGELYTGSSQGSVQEPEYFSQECGLILIMNLTSKEIDIVFDDSTAATNCSQSLDSLYWPTIERGNIYNIPPFASPIKKFSTSGIRRWHARLSDTRVVQPRAAGTVIVRSPDQ